MFYKEFSSERATENFILLLIKRAKYFYVETLRGTLHKNRYVSVHLTVF